jgi:predicted Zn-dependent protease
MKLKWIATAAVIGTIIMIGCAQVQDLGRGVGGPLGGVITGVATASQAGTLTEKDEDTFGRCLAVSVTNRYKVSSDRKLVTYVNYIGHTLEAVSSRPDRHFIFGVLETEQVGAFSGPNGYVFITRGAIDLGQDEAEIAGVLGHEMTHVINQDGLNAVKGEMIKSGLLQAGTAAAGVQQAMPALDQMGNVVLVNGYDKPQEFDADKGSVQLLVDAGYDPNSFLNYLKRLDAKQAANGGGGLMATHPGTHERIGKVATLIAEKHLAGGVTLRDRFLANADLPGA